MTCNGCGEQIPNDGLVECVDCRALLIQDAQKAHPGAPPMDCFGADLRLTNPRCLEPAFV